MPDNEVRRLVGVDGLDLSPLPCGAKDGLFPAVEFACALESPGLVGVSFLGCGVILYELVANLPVPIGTALGLELVAQLVGQGPEVAAVVERVNGHLVGQRPAGPVGLLGALVESDAQQFGQQIVQAEGDETKQACGPHRVKYL